jgi:hypothetical protein
MTEMTSKRFACGKCGRDATECGGHLERTNPGEMPAAWECRPSCDADRRGADRLIGAIEIEPPCDDCDSTENDRSPCPLCGKVLCHLCAGMPEAYCCDEAAEGSS